MSPASLTLQVTKCILIPHTQIALRLGEVGRPRVDADLYLYAAGVRQQVKNFTSLDVDDE